MSAIISFKKKPAKTSLSSSERTFKRLKGKIELLQQQLQARSQEFDKCLLYHHEKIQPAKMQFILASQKLIKIMYGYYKLPSALSKKERNILKKLIIHKMQQLFEMISFKEADPEICALFEDLHGMSYQELLADEINDLKSSMQANFKQEGVDIDLSDVDFTDDPYVVRQKIFEAMQEAAANREEEVSKPKSKSQLQKERKEQDLETLKKKGLNSIYKQLAKSFHPDLEQDLELRGEKEKLMKKLTAAYRGEDLYALLSLEMEWMSRSATQEKVTTEDQFKGYNALLKEQVKTLQKEIDTVLLNPKYLSIHAYLAEHMSDGIEDGMLLSQMLHRQVLTDIKHTKDFIDQLQSSQGKAVVKSLIREMLC